MLQECCGRDLHLFLGIIGGHKYKNSGFLRGRIACREAKAIKEVCYVYTHVRSKALPLLFAIVVSMSSVYYVRSLSATALYFVAC